MITGQTKQIEKFGQEAIDYIRASKQLERYVQKKALRSKESALTYKARLTPLGYFIFKTTNGKQTMDDYIEEMKKDKVNPYEFLSDYAVFLKNQLKTSDDDIRQKGKIARLFLRVSGVKIDAEEFREQVVLPRKVMPELEPAEKSQIVELLNACKNQRLKTAILMSASVGCRIQEACAVLNSDLNLEKGTITFRGENTKTKTTRTRPITAELVKQIKNWQALKYREHRSTVSGGKSKIVKPVMKDNDVMLAFWTTKDQPKPDTLADTVGNEFRELAMTLNIPKRNGKYVLTFHRLRAFVFSTISSLGDTEFANWFIGHSNSTYYRRSEKDKKQAFAKIENYLTFLNVLQFETTSADQESRIENLQAQMIKMAEDHKREMEYIFSLIQGNPKLADIKPTALSKKVVTPS